MRAVCRAVEMLPAGAWALAALNGVWKLDLSLDGSMRSWTDASADVVMRQAADYYLDWRISQAQTCLDQAKAALQKAKDLKAAYTTGTL